MECAAQSFLCTSLGPILTIWTAGAGYFQTDPSIISFSASFFFFFHFFCEIASHWILHITPAWTWPPPDCRAKYEYSSYKSWRRSPHTLLTVSHVCKIGVDYLQLLHSIYNLCLLLLCTTCMKCIKMIHRQCFFICKWPPQNESRFWKWPSSKMATPSPVTGKKRPVCYKNVTGNALIKKVQ